jgi:hypothetical protein
VKRPGASSFYKITTSVQPFPLGLLTSIVSIRIHPSLDQDSPTLNIPALGRHVEGHGHVLLVVVCLITLQEGLKSPWCIQTDCFIQAVMNMKGQ